MPAISKITIGAVLVCVVICIAFAVSALRDTPKEPFIGVAVFGDPVSIVFIDRSTKRTSYISFPASTFVDASSSYGTYPVSSLWRLGEIEKKGGMIFASSVGNALGIPIRYYIGPHGIGDTPVDLQEQFSQLFSIVRIPQILTGGIKTNLPFATYLEVTQAVGNSLSTSTILDLTKTYALSETENTDGTRVRKINPDGADLVFRQDHEIGVLRNENIRVSILNTTGILGLGQKVARELSHAGIAVIATDSEDKQFESCEVSAGKSVLSSVTVKSIVSFLSCSLRVSDDTGKADIILRLGKNEIHKF
jgi:hypothetical protein